MTFGVVMVKLAQIKVREPVERECYIPVTSDEKAPVRQDIIKNWEKLLNMVASMLNIPSSLIMHVHQDEIEVFAKDSGPDNPYEVNETAPLCDGLYCETVMGNRDALIVSDALESDAWRDNPDVELNMISYLGLPLAWPDSQLFGTICVLDSKKRDYSNEHVQLLETVQQVIQKDLEIIESHRKLEARLSHKELLMQELSHRTMNSFNSILSFFEFHKLGMIDDKSILEKIEGKLWNCVSLYEELCLNSTGIDMDGVSFIKRLMDLVLKTHSNDKICFTVTSEEFFLQPKDVVVVGEILTELTVNSIKYAYDELGDDSAIIDIEVKSTDDTLTITYRDNGSGMPDNIVELQSKSLGWQIINGLINRSRGELTIVPGKNGYVTFSLNTI